MKRERRILELVGDQVAPRVLRSFRHEHIANPSGHHYTKKQNSDSDSDAAAGRIATRPRAKVVRHVLVMERAASRESLADAARSG